MDYEVKVTSEAEVDFEDFLQYLIFVKRNPQAARHFVDDFEATKQTLSRVAGSLKLCDNPELNRIGYRRINFLTMNYFMLYRIEGKTAVVDNIFHGSQDYENKMI